MYVYQQYAHIFWIPTFPIGKTGATQCQQCQVIFKKRAFSPELKNHYQSLKSNQKTPIWTFVGLAVLAALTGIAILYHRQHSAHNTKIILAPKQGDIYEIKLDHQRYTLYKVERVAADTVYLIPNQYETNKMNGLSQLKGTGEENFIHASFPLMKTDLKHMLEAEEIMDIDRE